MKELPPDPAVSEREREYLFRRIFLRDERRNEEENHDVLPKAGLVLVPFFIHPRNSWTRINRKALELLKAKAQREQKKAPFSKRDLDRETANHSLISGFLREREQKYFRIFCCLHFV